MVAGCSALRCHGDLTASAGTFAVGARVCDGCGDFLSALYVYETTRVASAAETARAINFFSQASGRVKTLGKLAKPPLGAWGAWFTRIRTRPSYTQDSTT